MKAFLEKIRTPQKDVTSKYIFATVGFILLGFVLGVFQKWIDGTASHYFPIIFQQLDVGNYFMASSQFFSARKTRKPPAMLVADNALSFHFFFLL